MNQEDLEIIENIKSVLHMQKFYKHSDFMADKDMGQNFMADEGVLGDIVEASEASENDTVLEIGPGLGFLTKKLVEVAKKVIAVELDSRMVGVLKQRDDWYQSGKLGILEGDFLGLWKMGLVGENLPDDYLVVANVPYNITSHIMRMLWSDNGDKPPKRAVIMIQKEVGERICAIPGKMSVLGVMAQYYSEPCIVRNVTRDLFVPAPKVDSVVIRMDRRDVDRDKSWEDEFFRIVKIGFSSKRKKLSKNLANVFEKERVLGVFDDLNLSENTRAQDLSVDQWKNLVKLLTEKSF